MANYAYNIASGKFNAPGGGTTVPPFFVFGDTAEFALTFQSGMLEEGDVLTLAIDSDMEFYDPFSATGDASVMAFVHHQVAAGELTQLALSVPLATEVFRQRVNGRLVPLRVYVGLYLLRGSSYSELALMNGFARPVVAGPEVVSPVLPTDTYPTREEALQYVAAAKQSAEGAESAQIGAEAARDAAITAKNDAQTAATAANTAKDAAVTAQRNAETAKTGAETARDAAIAANNDAQTARNDANTAKEGAITAKNAAEVAKGGAESARDAATNAKNEAVRQAGIADDKAAEATSASNVAKGARDAAVSAKDATITAKNETITAKDTAVSARNSAVEAAQQAVPAAENAVAANNAAQQAKGYVESAVTLTETKASQTEAIYESIRIIVATMYIGPAKDHGLTKDGTLLSFTWTDPADNDVVRWGTTRLIYKQGGFPANENDGIVLVDNHVRNQYQTTPFTFDMLAESDYYFALFTQTTGGVWNTGDDCPRFTTDELTWQTIAMMTRAGTLLEYPGMAIGSVVDIQTNTLFPKLRWKLAHVDYKGTYANIEDYMLDNTRHHNSIWIPDKLLCLGESNDAMQVQFDAPENSYGATWDTVFINGKAYYTVEGETYTQLTAGEDYENGDDIAAWQTSHSKTVYTKNNADRVSSGCNSWMMSNLRQGLNKKGSDLFVPQNEYDVRSSHSFYNTGFLAGFSEGYLATVMQVRNKTARNTVSALTGGGGGGFDITLDKFWPISMKEFNNTNNNSIAEGAQLAFFRDVATTNAQRIQIDEGGTARNVWLRSAYTSYTRYVSSISTSGATNTNYTASYTYALLPAQCVA